MLTSSMMIIPTLIPFMKHPVSAGLLVLTQTLLVSLNSNMKYSNSWYSYILFMIMVGGLMVLFMYMTSVASNEKFKFSPKISLILLMSFTTLMLPVWQKITPLHLSNNEFMFSFTKYLQWPNSIMLMIMIVYLLITLIATIKIMEIKSGPLRQKF